MNEEWKSITGWPYEVSNFGRVRRAKPGDNTFAGRILRPCVQHDGYLKVHLRNGRGNDWRVAIHTLVLEAFAGPRPTPEHCAAHLDGVRGNCKAENLIWATPKENFQHRRLHGTYPEGELAPGAKLTWEDVLEIRRVYAKETKRKNLRKGVLQNLISRFGVSRSQIIAIGHGREWKTLPDWIEGG